MTLREDLESLYEYIKAGWMGLTTVPRAGWVNYGDKRHGCLMSGMVAVAGGVGGRRVVGMREALGFSCDGEMYSWNDVPGRGWDEVLDRIKTAIGES